MEVEASLFTDGFDAGTEVCGQRAGCRPEAPPPSQGSRPRPRRGGHRRGAEGRVPSQTWERRARASPFVGGKEPRDFAACCELDSEFDLGAPFSATAG